ncbi:MAG: hypothetical protein A2Y33_01545 [Spirochaetes bacterium GWF1_51_8]|nr:MAG: hypothetical protein A2Y33_01545 [Spirochaetes bacterium GWF1_51_8]
MKVFSIFALSLFAVFAVSCGNSGGSKTATNAPAQMHSMDHSTMDHSMGAKVSNETVLTCPVTGDKIEPGKEIRYTQNGYEFVLCCSSCIEDIKKDFEKYKPFGKKIE